MKKVNRFVAAATVALAASSVNAAPINFNPDGPGIDATVQANQFDWLPGNALAVGGNLAVQNFIDNAANLGGINTRPTTFTLLYQARMTSITNAANANVTPAGLDYPLPNPPTANEYELTLVASLQEKVTGFAVLGGNLVATFDDDGVVQTNNFIELYFDNTVATRANDLAGTGFNDGLRIARGTVNIVDSIFSVTDFVGPPADADALPPLDQNGGFDNYAPLTTVEGNGTTVLEATIDTSLGNINTAFFVDNPLALQFKIFTTTATVPFGTIDPSARFVTANNGAAPVLAGAGLGAGNFTLLGLGSVNGLPVSLGGGQSTQFQADASNTFLQTPGIVPEPATAMLGLMGLAGLALGRRNRKA